VANPALPEEYARNFKRSFLSYYQSSIVNAGKDIILTQAEQEMTMSKRIRIIFMNREWRLPLGKTQDPKRNFTLCQEHRVFDPD